MSLSASEVRLVVNELASHWQGAFVQKVHMRGPRVLQLSLRRPGENGTLTLSIDPQLSYLCLLPQRGESDPEASAFCMLLRRWFKGGRLESLAQVGADRVVEIRGSRGVLYVEMIGRHGAFVLCDEEASVLSVHPSGSHRIDLHSGRPYEPPRGGGRNPPPSRFAADRINTEICSLVEGSITSEGTSGRRDALARRLSKLVKKVRRRLGHIEKDLARAGGHAELAHQGELLKLHLGSIRRGMSSVTVTDLMSEEGNEIEIALDPKLTPSGNLERAFSKARRAKRAGEVAGKRRVEVLAELERLEELRARLETADDGDLEEIASLAGVPLAESPPKRRRGPAPRLPYKAYRDCRGGKVLVGRSAGDNDRLTIDVARPHDLWFHARGYHGSHVVLVLDKGTQVDSERLLDAATLAAHFSEARGNTSVEVTHTERRYVQKPRKAPPGQVVLLREKVVRLHVEPDRLRRLLEARQDS